MNFVIITNQEWLYYTYICLKSMKLSKKPESKYNIFILCIGFGNDYLIQDLDADDFRITPIFLSRNLFEKEHNVGIVYYKLLIQELLDVDYVFHIDADCVVVSDLSGVFQYKPKYLGAVIDRLHTDYYNMGNVLFHLENLRKLKNYVPYAFSHDLDDWQIGEYNELHSPPYLYEQDILNYLFRGSIEAIPYGYNVLVNLYPKEDEAVWMRKYHKLPAPEDVKIVHFAGMGDHAKPWQKPMAYDNQRWMNIWRAIERDESIQGMVKEACEAPWKNSC